MSILGLNERQRRLLIPAAGVVLAGFFFLGYQPLARRTASLDAPLENTWRKLALTLGDSNATTLDFAAIAENLDRTRASVAILAASRQQALRRIEPGQTLRQRLTEPFLLVEFQNEVQQQLNDLQALARKNKVTLAPAVAAGFPEHTADLSQPELLWAELAVINDALTLAINSRVTAIQSVSLPGQPSERPVGSLVARLQEVPVQIELSGPMPAVTRFLESLPLRPAEAEAAGLAALPADKPALFIDRILLRKEAPERPDQVGLLVRVTGFFHRDY